MLTVFTTAFSWIKNLFSGGSSSSSSSSSSSGENSKSWINLLLIIVAVVFIGLACYHVGGKMNALINTTNAALQAINAQNAKMDQQKQLLQEMKGLQTSIIEFNRKLSEDYYANKENRDSTTNAYISNVRSGDLRLRLNRPRATATTSHSASAGREGDLQRTGGTNQSIIGNPTIGGGTPADSVSNTAVQ